MSETKTPEQWAFALGQYKVGPKPRRIKQLSWQHNVAAVVHGWAQHEHDAQSPMQLTKSAYQGAIDAVEKQTSDGTLRPCDAALSPFCKLHKPKPKPKPKPKAPQKAEQQQGLPEPTKSTSRKKIRRRKSAPKKDD